ncbi:MAG: CHASE2 domain-containing protein [Hydrococcus sp. CRU_1_1]|nr:CHASE2 domain-containing protein [Hydrococcus sp. CRU_1_1]NJQ96796.1 CHASE2 domain-containing protein [Hydrococcus sp. CSU_1_8]
MRVRIKQIIRQWQGVFVTAPAIAGLVVAGSLTGVFQQMEWSAFDLALRQRPQEAPDPRLVIVTISESDIQRFKSWPLSDAILAQTLKKIEQQKPRAIGLDLYRDLPVEPGYQQLAQVFQNTSILFGIEKVIGNSVDASPILKQQNRVALADLILDADGKVRRALLSVKLENGQTRLSLGTALALKYLEADGIGLQRANRSTPNALQLGKATFIPFQENDGSYVRADNGGYQILLNYRGEIKNFQTVSLSDVVENRIPAGLMRDRIVLIGSTAESLNDHFQTPYSSSLSSHPLPMPGVVIHANIASQILSAALNGRPLLQILSDPQEWLWILFWSFVGASIGWKLLKKNPFRQNIVSLAILTVVAIVLPGSVLVGLTYLAFLGGWWLPVIAPLVAMSLSVLMIQGYRTSELQRQASLDSLTQVANRRYFNEYIEQQWYRQVETKQPLSVILCDVDHFKLYNDTYGHLAGDNCLQQVAKALGRAVRSNDLVARYGGEEFVIVLPNTNNETALQIAERINFQVSALHIVHAKSLVSDRVTLSCGVATIIPNFTSSLPKLIATADEALYEAKQKGRNRAIGRSIMQ